MKVVAFVPVKFNSERIDSKNLALVGGKPLFHWILDALTKCSNIDEVYLDTESDEVVSLLGNCQVDVLRRDPSLATNKTDGNQLLINVANQVDADIYVMALGTSPFLKAETIDRAIEVLKSSSEFDSVLAVFDDKLYTWSGDKPKYNIDAIPNSIDLESTLIETMGLYVVRKEVVTKLKRRIGDNPYLLKVSRLESIDINLPEDLEVANFVASDFRLKDFAKNQMMSKFLNSSMFSDAVDNLALDEVKVIKGLKSNIMGAKICGNIRTIKLTEVADKADVKKIYDGLPFLETLCLGDVAVVQNDTDGFAYWGELMSTIAMSHGCSGAVVSGHTRDSDDTRQLGFPVFAAGTTCADTKVRAFVKGVDCKVEVMGVDAFPGDFIFIDNEGGFVIPKYLKSYVLKEVKNIFENEMKIKADIFKGVGTNELCDEYGMF